MWQVGVMLLARYQPPQGITTHRQMFNAIAREAGLTPVIAEQIWNGARSDLMGLKTTAREKLKNVTNPKINDGATDY